MGLDKTLKGCHLPDPLGYIDFMAGGSQARLVLTDSGGIQEETTYLGVPCLTVRPNTERPVTITHGSNRLVACERALLVNETQKVLNEGVTLPKEPPPKWDGHTAERIAELLRKW